ncbi:hypothetical protein VTL71DRAFT_7389 [Oculimacula yallundae]|uniref:NADP-dependent oxidoreductase domain-containing protein n=1 Tax=Oculimacula yallundae TaxID=86028 RepID=A0ABR4BV68_9HELO
MDPFRGPQPKSLLGRHRVLSPSASIRVSPLFLGTSVFGTAWEGFLGACSKETAFAILDHYYAAGGNVIDSANFYQNGESEIWLGEWLALRENRNDLVLISKYSSNMMLNTPEQKDGTILSNYGGNNPKSLKLSVEKTLKVLGTSYLDLLYVHWWDFATSPAELMRSLNRLIADGTVLYLGASDMPAWFVVKCNAFARQHGLAPFVIYTGRWNVADRDMERDILDMCAAEDMAVSPYEVLGGGRFKTTAQRAAQVDERMELNPGVLAKFEAVGKILASIAETKGTLPTSIAIAYVMQKQAYVFPLVGGRKVEYLQANIEALAVRLSEEEVKAIEEANVFEKGFPYDLMSFFGPFDGVKDVKQMTGIYDYVEKVKAIQIGE